MPEPNSPDHTPLQGHCFCGAIRYELTAPPIFVNACHCRDCQAITGSVVSMNIIIENRHLKWSSTDSTIEPITRIAPMAGSQCKDSIETSAAATADTAAPASAPALKSEPEPEPEPSPSSTETLPACQTTYCPNCNTLLWATLGRFGAGIRFVRAGTLNESESIVPDAHFFVRSKAPWIELPSGVPAFDTLPTESFFSEESVRRMAEAS